MQITLNGQTIDTQQTRLDALLKEQGFDEDTVATAVDQQFIPKASRAATFLDEGSVVEVVAPMQGG